MGADELALFTRAECGGQPTLFDAIPDRAELARLACWTRIAELLPKVTR